MSNLSTKQRNDLPDSAFCYVKGNVRLFPVLDASDVSSAAHLIGKSPDPEATKRCIVRKAKAKGWPIPDAWKSDSADHAVGVLGEPCSTCGDAVNFADMEMVVRKGKLWEAGEYESHGYAMTPEELLAATIDFTPVPIDTGHPQAGSPLDGKLGQVQSIELGEDGKSLMGTVALPRWLDDMLGDAERKVSASWDRASKRLTSLSLVTNPRIEDAALYAQYAAFAKRHDTHSGQSAIQTVHDVAAQSGAVCNQGNAAQMSSRHEMTALQSIHDMTTQHGAQCHAVNLGPLPAVNTGRPPTVLYSGADALPAKRSTIMSWLDKFKAAVAEIPDATDPAAFSGQNVTTLTVPATATAITPSDTEKALRAELTRLRGERITEAAAAFAEKYIKTENKAFPAEREAIINAYTLAAADDVTFGAATFANGSSTTRVSALAAAYDARPAHQLTMDQITPGMMAIFNQQQTATVGDADKPLSPGELDKLLAQTSLGSSVLRDRNGASRN